MVMKLNKMVLDNKKIEEAAINKCGFISSEFCSGAKWAINESLKDLWHPASEEPDKHRICLVRVVYHLNNGMLPDEERIEQSSFHDFGWYDYDFKYIGGDRKSTRLNSSHSAKPRMPSSA